MVISVLDKLKSIRQRNELNKSASNKGLFKLLCSKELLIISYNKIKSKPGNMTPGTDNITLDGFSEKTLDSIIEDLKNYKYSFKPVRRIYIPKSNKDKLRPLGIPSPRDKIVQQAMLYILESIYEPIFSPHSHGFRPGRSCHSALREIRSTWSGMKWAIEGDIKGCYDNVDQNILISILRKKINDERFIQIVWKLLRSGIILNKKFVNTKIGTPQGGILSPILANIYLNELDEFVSQISMLLNSENPRRPNPEYKKLESNIWRLNDKMRKNDNLSNEQLSEIKILLKSLNEKRQSIPSKDPFDLNYVKIRYIRYADDWIIGIIGKKELAKEIKILLETFLIVNLKLNLSLEKTKITHFPSREVIFLSFQIQIGRKSNITTTSKSKRRSAGWQPRLFMPTENIIKKLKEKNFCKNGKGIRKKGWILYPDDIITKRYNAILLGIRNYYSPADNYNKGLARIQYILKYSWAHTLASKHRTKISKQLSRTNKLNLNIEKKLTNNIWDFKTKITDPYIGLKVSPLRSKLLSSDQCKICGTKEDLEMHHLKALKKDGVLLEDRYMAALMQRMNRKQICVCRNCHINIHKGTYDGQSLKFYIQTTT